VFSPRHVAWGEAWGRPAIEREAAHAGRGVPNRGEHRQAAERAAADIEGHPAAAKFSQPGRLSAEPRQLARRRCDVSAAAVYCSDAVPVKPEPAGPTMRLLP
jgi:hypothetical protein